MRITDFKKKSVSKRPKPHSAPKDGATFPPFIDRLQKHHPTEKQQSDRQSLIAKDIEAMLKNLLSVEEEFLDHPNEENLQRYREIIQEILTRLIDESKKIIYLEPTNRFQQKHRMMIINTIDKNLDWIAKAIIGQHHDKQGNRIENRAFLLAKKMSNIRGLLIQLIG